MKTVCICGHFGRNKSLLNGQTIKTKIISKAIIKKLGESRVHLIDTHGGVSHLPRLLFQVICSLFHCKNIVILPAQNGLKVFAPLLRILNVLFRRKLHYVVIGGWLPVFIVERPLVRWALHGFDGIYVETKTMKKELAMHGFDNILLMPNCKDLTPLNPDDLIYAVAEPYKLCTFSRVMQEKGIATAIDAVTAVNHRQGKAVFSLDIFGPVDPAQAEWFQKLQSTFPDYVTYRGKVHYENSVDTLKDYFALLFPTQYYTEGVPGTIIDAYAAGIPIIASKWESFSDVIDVGVTGYGYEFTDEQGLMELLLQIADNPGMITQIKENCIKKAEYYLPEKSVNTIVETITVAS